MNNYVTQKNSSCAWSVCFACLSVCSYICPKALGFTESYTLCIYSIHTVSDTVWRVIFVESPKRPSKLIFVVLNFVTATSPGAWHCCTNDDAIDTCTHDLLCFILAKPYL